MVNASPTRHLPVRLCFAILMPARGVADSRHRSSIPLPFEIPQLFPRAPLRPSVLQDPGRDCAAPLHIGQTIVERHLRIRVSHRRAAILYADIVKPPNKRTVRAAETVLRHREAQFQTQRLKDAVGDVMPIERVPWRLLNSGSSSPVNLSRLATYVRPPVPALVEYCGSACRSSDL